MMVSLAAVTPVASSSHDVLDGRGRLPDDFCQDLGDPEGPGALPDGTWLAVEGAAERGCVTQIRSDGQTERIIQKTGLLNGLAVDHDGVIWVAESKVPPYLSPDHGGKGRVVATDRDGEPFLFPNDLCFGPDGAIYLAD